MILPFVRELLADLENSVPFDRVRRHLSAGSGRRRVSGLTFTARALCLPFFVRAANAPCLILVADNKAAEELHAAALAACELTGALAADCVLRLPAHDVLPFKTSPRTRRFKRLEAGRGERMQADSCVEAWAEMLGWRIFNPVERWGHARLPGIYFGSNRPHLQRGVDI